MSLSKKRIRAAAVLVKSRLFRKEHKAISGSNVGHFDV